MRTRDIWYGGAVVALAWTAATLLMFNWQNPELTEIQVLQALPGWDWRGWAPPFVVAAVYVVVAFVVKWRRA